MTNASIGFPRFSSTRITARFFACESMNSSSFDNHSWYWTSSRSLRNCTCCRSCLMKFRSLSSLPRRRASNCCCGISSHHRLGEYIFFRLDLSTVSIARRWLIPISIPTSINLFRKSTFPVAIAVTVFRSPSSLSFVSLGITIRAPWAAMFFVSSIS